MPSFISQCHALSSFLVARFPSISKNYVALVLPPPSLHVPVIFFTLLSLGIVVFPANPLSSASDIRHWFISKNHEILSDCVGMPSFISQCHALSSFLVAHFPSISKNDVALVLLPPSLYVPVIFFTLLSLGIVVSPANPLSSASDIHHWFISKNHEILSDRVWDAELHLAMPRPLFLPRCPLPFHLQERRRSRPPASFPPRSHHLLHSPLSRHRRLPREPLELRLRYPPPGRAQPPRRCFRHLPNISQTSCAQAWHHP